MKKRILLFSAVGIALFLIVHFFYSNAQKPTPLVNVSISTVNVKDVTINLQTIGTVQAYSSVDVKSMVTGPLDHTGFKEGDLVEQNQILFSIDQRPFKAALEQAKANLARDLATHNNASALVKRNAMLVQKGFVSKQDYDTLLTNEKSIAATVKADEAAMENANLQLSYATIRAPISGKTGNILLKTGSLIKANDTMALVTINQINPINVVFSIPQNHLLNIQKNSKQEQVPVKAIISGDKVDTGTLSFIDNNVNVATGTIQLKATFPNKDRFLWPGQYVTVDLPVEHIQHAVLIPSLALLTGQKGFYVFVVDDSFVVKMRTVTPGAAVGNETVILEGLKPGERVVTAGQLRLQEGMKVKIELSASG